MQDFFSGKRGTLQNFWQSAAHQYHRIAAVRHMPYNRMCVVSQPTIIIVRLGV